MPYNPPVPELSTARLDRVLAQLQLYEHPLLNFSARSKGEAVEVIIQFKDASIPVHTYYFDLHPRDLDHPQFEWTFQRQLYDALHDYFVEMFIRTPQDRIARRENDRIQSDRMESFRLENDRPESNRQENEPREPEL